MEGFNPMEFRVEHVNSLTSRGTMIARHKLTGLRIHISIIWDNLILPAR